MASVADVHFHTERGRFVTISTMSRNQTAMIPRAPTEHVRRSPLRRRARTVADGVLGPWAGSINGVAAYPERVGLTFDDGPDPASTLPLLRVLARHDARATFFLLADRAADHPDLVRAILEAGHEVGLHGRDHLRPTRLAPIDLAAWLTEGRSTLESLVGLPVRWFRPPFGAQSLRTFRAARRVGLDVVVWQTDSGDWRPGSPAEVASRGLARLRRGGILLLHERLDDVTRPAAFGPGQPGWHAAVAQQILTGLDRQGWQADSVGGLLAGRRAHRTAWFRS